MTSGTSRSCPTRTQPELAYLPTGTDGYRGYWAAMEFALRFAEVNRSRMLDAVELASGSTRASAASSG